MKDKPWFVTCATKEGRKSYECKVKNGGGAKKKKKKQTSKLSNTYTNKVDKKASTPYLLKKKKNDKVVAIKVNKQADNGAKRIWVSKEIISNMKSTKKVWIPKGKWEVQWTSGNLETWQSMGAFHGVHHYRQGNCQVVSEYYRPKFPFPC